MRSTIAAAGPCSWNVLPVDFRFYFLYSEHVCAEASFEGGGPSLPPKEKEKRKQEIKRRKKKEGNYG